jgi:hypothetical protein
MKSNQATVRQRVEEILSLRLLGAEFPDIRQYASQKEWNVTDRQLWRYIHAGDDFLAQTLEQDHAKLVNRHIAQRRALYARAAAVSDYRTCLAILRDEAELLSLYPPKRTEVSGPDGGPLQTVTTEMTDEERAAAITAILARVGPGLSGPAGPGEGNTPGPPLGGPGPTADPCGVDPGPLAGKVAALQR